MEAANKAGFDFDIGCTPKGISLLEFPLELYQPRKFHCFLFLPAFLYFPPANFKLEISLK